MIKQLIDKFFWAAALASALVATPYAYYLTYPTVRPAMDARVPQLREFNARVAAWWDQKAGTPTAPAPTAPPPVETREPQPVAAATPAPVVEEAPAPVAVVESPAPPPQPPSVDLAQLSHSRTEWPKTVTLKKSEEFPAVHNGRVIGSVQTPPGTQARLTVIRGDKIGVEFQGGIAMVEARDTDLIEQVRAFRLRHPGRAASGS